MSKRAGMLSRLPVCQRLRNDQRYRAFLTAEASLAFNLLYALYHGVLGVTERSYWFFTMFAYYAVLSVTRFSIVLCEYRKGTDRSTKRLAVRVTGCLLAALSVVLAGVMYLSMSKQIVSRYDKILMITIAAYTFTKLALAIRRFVKARRQRSLLLTALRVIGYADTAASVLTLQRSMLASFGDFNSAYAKTINTASGAFVCAFVLVLGVVLIYQSFKEEREMAKSKLVKANEKIAEKVTGAYKAVENAVVGGYTKVEDAFVDRYLTHDGETVEEAKKRLKGK